MDKHEEFMAQAIKMAEKAAQRDEVPVGAVVVCRGKVIARAGNKRESLKDPLAHAELLAIRKAARRLGGWRLLECVLYVTLEPCAMCAGAIINARIGDVVFGAYDPKGGAFGSLYNLAEGRLNHTPRVRGGVLQQRCASLLKNYFRAKR